MCAGPRSTPPRAAGCRRPRSSKSPGGGRDPSRRRCLVAFHARRHALSRAENRGRLHTNGHDGIDTDVPDGHIEKMHRRPAAHLARGPRFRRTLPLSAVRATSADDPTTTAVRVDLTQRDARRKVFGDEHEVAGKRSVRPLLAVVQADRRGACVVAVRERQASANAGAPAIGSSILRYAALSNALLKSRDNRASSAAAVGEWAVLLLSSRRARACPHAS